LHLRDLLPSGTPTHDFETAYSAVMGQNYSSRLEHLVREAHARNLTVMAHVPVVATQKDATRCVIISISLLGLSNIDYLNNKARYVANQHLELQSGRYSIS
jgi:hypothetical protein